MIGTSVVSTILLATCLLEGRVSDPQGIPLGGVQVVRAENGALLGSTDEAGRFRLETEDATSGTTLEFRRAQRVPLVKWFRCGDTSADVSLAPLLELDPLHFSASRLEPLYAEAPIRARSVNAAKLADVTVSSPSLAQLLKQVPSVGGLGRDGLTTAPTIRGLGRERSIILVEGMRISSDRGVGPTASFVDPFLLGHVEVVRGSSGVAWGSGAMGGVIATGLGSAPSKREASLKVSATTNGDGRLVAGRVGGPLGRGFRVTTGGFFRTQDDYEFAATEGLDAGKAPNSGFENAGGTAAFERPLHGGSLRIASLVTRGSDIGRPTLQERRLDTIVDEDHALVSAGFQRETSERRTELGVAWHRPFSLNRSERFATDGSRSRTEDVDNESHDLGGSWLVERPWTHGTWVLGGDLFARVAVESDETTTRFSDGAVASVEFVEPIRHGKQMDWGTFLGWKHPLRATGQWMLAGRIDLAQRSASDRASVDEVAPSLNASAIIPLSDSWAATGSVGRTFRAPRLQELYFEGNRPAGYRLANPDLVPETAWSAETGVRGTFGRWSADAEIWGMVVRDLIVQLPIHDDTDTLRFENEATGDLAGVELEIAWRDAMGRGDVELGAAWVRAVNEDGEPLPDVPPHAMRVAGEWSVYGSPETRSAAVRAALRAGGAKTPLAAGEGARWWSDVLGTSGAGGDESPIPGFAHVDAGVRFRVAPLVALDLAIANVFDDGYLDRPETDAYPQPGRALQIELLLGTER